MSRLRLVERRPGWGREQSVWRPDHPVFWLSLGLAVAGVSLIQSLVGSALALNVGPASLMAVAWALYLLPFLALIAVLDLHEPEPPSWLAAALAWGALVAAPLAYVANTAIRSVMYKQLADDVALRWFPSASGPWTEELLKALGFVVIIALARNQITTVLDGIVYGAFIGLGFQVAENVVLTTRQLAAWRTTDGEVVWQLLAWRGLGQGLWSHAVYTAIVGAGVGVMVTRPDRRWLGICAVGGSLAVACGLHFVWNSPWWPADTSTFEAADLRTYLAKGVPALLLVTGLVVVARLREVDWFAGALQDRSEVSTDEVATLRTWSGRRRARRAVAAIGGRRARRAGRQLQAAQVRLAVAISTEQPDDVVAGAAERVRFTRAVLERTVASGQ